MRSIRARDPRLVEIRALVDLATCEHLERSGLENRRTRQEETGLRLDEWAQRYQPGALLPDQVGADPADLEIRCTVLVDTRQLLDVLARHARRSRQGLAGMILSTWSLRLRDKPRP